jgi:hypothetical protein
LCGALLQRPRQLAAPGDRGAPVELNDVSD